MSVEQELVTLTESRQDSGNLYKYVCIITSQRNAKSNNLTLLQY